MVELLRRRSRRAVRSSTLDRPLGLRRPAVVGRDPPAGAQLRRVRLHPEQELTRFPRPARASCATHSPSGAFASGDKWPRSNLRARSGRDPPDPGDRLPRTHAGHGDRARPAPSCDLAPLPRSRGPSPTATPSARETFGDRYRRQLAANLIDLRTEKPSCSAALKIHANVDEDRDEAVQLLRCCGAART